MGEIGVLPTDSRRPCTRAHACLDGRFQPVEAVFSYAKPFYAAHWSRTFLSRCRFRRTDRGCLVGQGGEMKIGHCGGIGILAVIYACGGKSSSGSEDVAAAATLNIAVTGQGTVTSPDGINCTGNCAQPTTVGKRVHLDAMPAAGMQFTGWIGACSGTGGCDLNISGETRVGASFAAGQVTIEVQLTGTGSGRVTSAPAGIDCPGTCAMAMAPGTVITMSQTARTDSSFIGWGGGCSGLSCVVTASATTKPIFANFGLALQPADPCAGIAIPAVTRADLKTFDVTGSNGGCLSAGTDLLGNLYVTADYAKTFVVTSTGHTVQNAFLAASLRS